MFDFILGVAFILLGAWVAWWLGSTATAWVRQQLAARRGGQPAAPPAAPPPTAPPAPQAPPPDEGADDATPARVLADMLEREALSPTRELLKDPRVAAVLAPLVHPDVPAALALELARASKNVFANALGLMALEARDDPPPGLTDWALLELRIVTPSLEPLLFDVLARHADSPVIARALSLLEVSVARQALAEFIPRRMEREEVTNSTFEQIVDGQVEEVADLVRSHETELGPEFCLLFRRWSGSEVDVAFLRDIGTVWEVPYDRPETLLVGDRPELFQLMSEALAHDPPRSLLLVGDHGVGKTALARAALDRSLRKPVVFEATATRINAGASYIGQLEGRATDLVKRLGGRNVVWILPQLQEALYAGQHNRSPQGLLDALLPHIESGELCIVGEVGNAEFEQLLAARARIASAFDIVRVRPLAEAETVEVVRHALASEGKGASASGSTLLEAHELAQQFMPGIAAPGNTLRLVSTAGAEVLEEGRTEITSADVLTTLAATTGLPLPMLDPSILLPLADVRAFFEERILGQSEAVDGVVERIAIARAGLNDPTRPLGVLLLVGPTGTGKTELAKTLAEFMFGSPGRLVRIDMSEFQTYNSLERLLSDTNVDPDGAPLIAAVRKDPFSVVLLDEFEKAAPPIWDVFLQVFDDGRLTDVHGRVVDFRRCVFLLTSNIGSAITSGNPVGFDRTKEGFKASRIEEAVSASFRPEFLNRIDRVIVFRPFDRPEMRALLEKELREVLTRRGLRTRPWAVELDEAASEFIIEQGFSPALGARPLKRAVERHLLAPLAEVIVEQTAPEGDLFLFVTHTEAGGIGVSFVNLEDSGDVPLLQGEPLPGDEGGALDLRALALTGRADPQDVRLLLGELDAVMQTVFGEIEGRKAAALGAMAREGFWEDDGRFATLAEIEYIERLVAATATAERLGARVARQAGETAAPGAGNVVSLVASRLLVLQAALAGLQRDAPQEVYLRVRPAADAEGEAGEHWIEQVVAMYEAWALARGMTMERIGETRLYRVAGLGAGEILEREDGLHVLEVMTQGDDGDRLVERVSCVVEIAPRSPQAAAERSDAAADAALALRRSSAVPTVVRRYRPAPTPLVRDAVRGYRTGRIDRVLAGDFDLFGG